MEELKEGWRRVKLGEVIEIEMGQSPKSEFYNSQGLGMPFLQGNRTFGDKYPYFDTYCTNNKKMALKKDVIMSVRAPVGDLNIATENISIGRGVCALRAKNNQNQFLYYLLKYNVKNLINKESGTVFGSVNKNDILGLEIDYPEDIKIQEKIASILSALDDKIEINNEMNKTLEEMAETLFKRWFIDFDFPNENGKPYKSSGGKMVDSELGEIPEGWRVGNLEDLGSIMSGGTPSKSKDEYYTTNGIPWITPKDLSINKNKFIKKGALDITKEGLNKSSAKFLPKGTVLFSSRAPIGYLAIAEIDVTTNQGFKSIVPKNFEYTEFIYQLLKEITPYIESVAGGSTFKEISSQGMKSINIVIPLELFLKKFYQITNSFNKRIQSLEKEIQSLTEIRDILLPKLMSGEVEV